MRREKVLSGRIAIRRERDHVGRVVDIVQGLVQHRKRIGDIARSELVSYVDDDLAKLLLVGFGAFQLLDEPRDFGLVIGLFSHHERLPRNTRSKNLAWPDPTASLPRM